MRERHYSGSGYMYVFKRRYLIHEKSYEYAIVAQSSVILNKFVFKKNFRCFLDNNYTYTIYL